jgi:hypothetical protein
MGCWNKTCGLSNLHITAGTPVYTFVLEYRTLPVDDFCYSTSLFRPLLLPFVCEYDDYGGGENSSGLSFQLIMNSIKRDLVEVPLGDNQYHDIAVTREEFGERLFFESVHEGRLQIKSPYSAEPTNLTFTMFRKDVVDSILERQVMQRYVGGGKGTCGWDNNYVRYRFSDVIADIPRLLEDVQSKLIEDSHRGLLMGLRSLMGSDYDNLTLDYLTENNSYRYSSIVNISSLMRDGFENGSPVAMQRLQEVLTEYIRGVVIDQFMHRARKTWIPGGHEGSQSTSSGALRLLSEVTLWAIDRERAEWLEANGELDESDPEDKYIDG